MKKIFVLWVILSLLLTSCSIDWNDEKDLFTKKQECANNKSKMEEDWNEEVRKIWIVSWDPYRWEVSEIFYSKKLNSCLYVFNIYKEVNMDYQWQEILLSTFIYDFLTKKEIISSIWKEKSEVDNKIKELKWE